MSGVGRCPVDAAFMISVSLLSILLCCVTFLCGRHLYLEWTKHKQLPDNRYAWFRAICAISIPFVVTMNMLVLIAHTSSNRPLFWTTVSFQMLSGVMLTISDKMAEFYKLHDTFVGSMYALPRNNVFWFSGLLTVAMIVMCLWWIRVPLFGSWMSKQGLSSLGIILGFAMVILFGIGFLWILLQFEQRLTELVANSDGVLNKLKSQSSFTNDDKNNTNTNNFDTPEFRSMESESGATPISLAGSNDHRSVGSISNQMKVISRSTISDIRLNEQQFIRVVAKECVLTSLIIISLFFLAISFNVQSVEPCPSILGGLVMSVSLSISVMLKAMVRFHFREVSYQQDYYRWLGWLDRLHVKIVVFRTKQKAVEIEQSQK